MRHGQSGFTLPETLIATALIVSGLASVAWVFTVSIRANMETRQRAAAVILATEKLEEFQAAPWSDPKWSSGGGLNPLVPVTGYSDVVVEGRDRLLRLWEVTGPPMRTATVSIHFQPDGGPPKLEELFRASVTASPGF